MKKLITGIFSLISFCLLAGVIDRGEYPSEWWVEIPPEQGRGWEILPHKAKPGEVILSKRTVLGVFSNFAKAPFILDGIQYSSIEGLWQGLKYPDPDLAGDTRFNILDWPHTRAEVFAMDGWDAKSAGNQANGIMNDNQIDYVTYFDKSFNYVDGAEGSAFHLELITRAIREKVLQNPMIKDLLIQTKGLILRPDHFMSNRYPDSFYYHKILMKIRDEEL
ncbi:MAG: hypothetical protein K9K67_12625 [Bacteriovoracaceae bacterium]|nr:hypothetical protein [Bacteriovoracaceae bacterium]